MNIEPGDSVLATIKQINSDEIFASTSRWDNVSQFLITCSNSNVELFPGKSLPVEIDQKDGEVVHGSTIRGAYARYVWPGDTIEVTVTHFSENGFAVDEYDTPNCDQVHIVGAVPAQTVEVRILKLSDGIAIGEARTEKSTGLEIGDRIPAIIKEGTSVASPKEGAFQIYLSQGLNFNISSEVVVTVTDLDGQVEAQIHDPGRLPIPRNKLRAKVTQGTKKAQVIDGGYEVALAEPALATGEVQIRIDENSSETPTATVVSYEGLLPNVGDAVQVWSVKAESKAIPEEGTYQVELPALIPVHTQFTVEIESIDKTIKGDLVDVGSLPVPGNEVEVEVVRNESRATAIVGEYPIKLQNPALVSAQTTVCIDSRPTESERSVAKGHVSSYEAFIPSIGSIVSASCSRGSSVAEPANGNYRIQLPRETQIDAAIEIKITSVSPEGVSGEIVGFGVLPVEGNEVMARVVRDDKIATCSGGDYPIKLPYPSLVTGEVVVAISSEPGQTEAEGTISSYEGQLPKTGNRVSCRCDSGSRFAEPLEGTYCITLDEETPIETNIEVEVKKVSDTGIRGEIVDYGVIPDEGDVVKGSVVFGETRVKFEDEYYIQVVDPAAASGTAKVQIESVTASEIHGSILNNQGIPDIGETLYAEIGPQKQLAEPLGGEYEICLEHPSTIGQKAVVEIVGVDDNVYGKVKRQETKKVFDGGESEGRESKNDLLNQGGL